MVRGAARLLSSLLSVRGWIGYMGWPLYGLITRAAEQSNYQIARRQVRWFKIQIVPETTTMSSCAVL